MSPARLLLPTLLLLAVPIYASAEPNPAKPREAGFDRAPEPLPVRAEPPAARLQPLKAPRLMLFTSASTDEHWSLLDAEGTALCDLPCTRVVPFTSKYRLVSKEDLSVSLWLPDDPGFEAARTVRMIATQQQLGGSAGRRAFGIPARILALGGLGTMLDALWIGVLEQGASGKGDVTSQPAVKPMLIAGGVSTGVGLLLLLLSTQAQPASYELRAGD